MTRFSQEEAKPGSPWTDWIQPVRKGYKLACCDCGLVHGMDFRVHKGRPQFRVRRLNRSTAMVRRHAAARKADESSKKKDTFDNHDQGH